MYKDKTHLYFIFKSISYFAYDIHEKVIMIIIISIIMVSTRSMVLGNINETENGRKGKTKIKKKEKKNDGEDM